MGTYRSRWWDNSDRAYHRAQHQVHAVKNWWHVILGGLFVLFLLLCCCGGVFNVDV